MTRSKQCIGHRPLTIDVANACYMIHYGRRLERMIFESGMIEMGHMMVSVEIRLRVNEANKSGFC